MRCLTSTQESVASRFGEEVGLSIFIVVVLELHSHHDVRINVKLLHAAVKLSIKKSSESPMLFTGEGGGSDVKAAVMMVRTSHKRGALKATLSIQRVRPTY